MTRSDNGTPLKSTTLIALLIVSTCSATADGDNRNEKNAEIAFKKGKELVSQKKEPQALPYFSLALKLRPNHPWAHLDRGTTYRDLGNMKSAMQDFKESMRINRTDAWGPFHYAKQLHKEKKYKEAIEYYNMSTRLDPKQYWFHYDKARAQISIGKYKDAIAELNTDVRLDRHRTQAYSARAQAWEKLGRKDLAESDRKQGANVDLTKVDLSRFP
jgi:tetratricopeptide (TPR) repeat protein